jgi:hypothetical protein
MAHKSFVLLVVGTVVFFLCSNSSADVPGMIDYQGKLTTSEGALVNDTVQMTFSIYPDTLGSPADWTETQDSVIVKEGIFNVLLGSVDSIPSSVFDGNIKYLGVQVESDPEMRPLKPMVSVAYAYRAGTTDGGGGGWVDDGGVVRLETISDSVGIGTTAPTEKLDVVGNIHASGSIVSGSALIGMSSNPDRLTADGDIIYLGYENPPGSGLNLGPIGIARYGNTLYGTETNTHINLGVNSTTGISGGNNSYCTVGGGLNNTASGDKATIAGGDWNTASGLESVVGGGASNTTSGGGATVGGGWLCNAGGLNSTIAGGWINNATSDQATIGGGNWNTASGYESTVGGGAHNTASGVDAVVPGGYGNIASGDTAIVGGGAYNTASGAIATIGGGSGNSASAIATTVGGGLSNTADGDSAIVGGGAHNNASGTLATIGGGNANYAGALATTIGGGWFNTADGYSAIVGGGTHNSAREVFATIGGGWNNTVLDTGGTIGGGTDNTVNAYGSTVPGGCGNNASGAYSFAAGRQVTVGGSNTFAFGYDFTTWADHAVIFHNSHNPIKVGIGTETPINKLDVEGGVAVGAGYSGANTAPTNGMIIEGNVGIGTTTPAFPLSFSSTHGDKISLWSSPGYHYGFGILSNRLLIHAASSSDNIVLGYGTSSSFTELMRIKGNGSVGIGTETPINKLDVEGGVAVGAGYSGANTAPTNGMIIEGNVGIGTIDPQRALHVVDVMRLEPRQNHTFAPSPRNGDLCVTDAVSPGIFHIYCYLNGLWRQLDP